jgi:hypothetical protein
LKELATKRCWSRLSKSVPVVVCLILLTLISVVQVMHLHQTAAQADQCALCIVMHSTAPLAIASVAVLLVQLGVAMPVVSIRAPIRFSQTQLYTRPPPQSR